MPLGCKLELSITNQPITPKLLSTYEKNNDRAVSRRNFRLWL